MRETADGREVGVAIIGAGFMGDTHSYGYRRVGNLRRALDQADVVVHDAAIAPAVLELARREADILTLHDTVTVPPLPQLLAQRAAGGRHVLYLSCRPCSDSLAAAIRAVGPDVTLIPGVPADPAIQRQEQA